jgi:serine/threonine-protein kinase
MASARQIGGYEVLATLGHGARSTIYAVKDRDGQVYALKHVVKQNAADQWFLDQAILEHEVASRFAHPALRQSFKIIRRRRLMRVSEIFVLMEMVDGVTLEDFRSKRVPELTRMCLEVASGLQEMHDGGYVHADIKPNNVMVTEGRHVKIIDFGQSCPIGTIKERIQGTPDYIAPEQVLRRRITPRTDVFNLGATMYWLFTGRHVPTLIPKGRAGVDFKTDKKVIAPRELNEHVPPALSGLILQCVEPSPLERPETMLRVEDRLRLVIAQLERDEAIRKEETKRSAS